MRTAVGDGAVLPVRIEIEGRKGHIYALTNRKGYFKSIERNEFWMVDSASGRLIPAEFISDFRGIVQEDTGAYVVQAGSIDEEAFANYVHDMSAAHEAAESGKNNQEVEADGAEWDASAKILATLESTIETRKAEMPEGSYTTHLFSKGVDKILKKTGEEAVELLLSRSNEELASETADLFYHLMVLYSAKGLSLTSALKVLADRH